MVESDEVDEAIIRLLQEDGRRGNRDVARVLGVSEGTVRNRRRRLEVAGAMRIGVVMTAEALDQPVVAYVRLVVAPRFVPAVARVAASLPEAPFVAVTIGRYSLTLAVIASGSRTLSRLVHEKLKTLEGVQEIEVREIAEVVKHRIDLVRLEPPAAGREE